jgi:hypothetical protein
MASMDDLENLLVATSDYTDDGLHVSLAPALSAVRESLDMDVVFVAKIAEGRREFKAVQSAPGIDLARPGMSDPVEQSWCHMIVEGRLPELIPDAAPWIAAGRVPYTPLQIGTHLSVPVVLRGGRVYGTLCCFALSVKSDVLQKDVEALRHVASVLAARIDGAS